MPADFLLSTNLPRAPRTFPESAETIDAADVVVVTAALTEAAMVSSGLLDVVVDAPLLEASAEDADSLDVAELDDPAVSAVTAG